MELSVNSEEILNLNCIKKSFGGVHALKGVDFHLIKGEVHALLGENGAGKSTLIKILTGVHHPDEGTIVINGKDVTISSTIDARRKGIAAIYQELSLIDSLSVAENVFLGNEAATTKFGLTQKKQLYAESDALLARFGISIPSKAMVGNLGLGQKRVIEIVKALAINAEILLLDEPTTGMSATEIDTLFEIIESLKEKKITMIYISHYLDEVFKCCDRATVLRDGNYIDTFRLNEVTVSDLVQAMIGHSITAKRYRSDKPASMPKIVLEAKGFKTQKMMHSVNFSLHQGEILGITGIVGAGKSELAISLFGAYTCESGELLINGKPVVFKSPSDTKKHAIAFIPEDRKTQGLFLEDSIENNLVLPNIEKVENRFGLLDLRKKTKEAENIGKQMQLQPLDVKMKAGNLSGGNQQKVVLGKWLAADPSIVLLDEPTRGIDVGAKSEIYRLINQMAEEGKSIIVFSSEMEELLGICDRILVLCKGRIVGETAASKATIENLLTLALGAENNEQ